MKILFIVAGAIIAILVIFVIVVYLIGSRLPESHVASRSIRLNRPLNDVYSVVRDFGSSPKWRSDVKSVEMLGNEDGHIRFREHGSNGIVTYELLDEVPNQRIVTRIVDRDLGYSGSWTYVFSTVDDSTLVTITENGIVSNPMFRFMLRYVFGETATIDAYLTALARHFGEPGTPQDAKLE